MTAPGVYRAVVANNVDPEGLSRLKVVIPAIAPESESGWCWPVVPAWNWPVPAVGDPVWIMFEAANEGYPVWIGTWVRLQDVYEAAAVPGGTSPGRPPVEFGGGGGGDDTGTTTSLITEALTNFTIPINSAPVLLTWKEVDPGIVSRPAPDFELSATFPSRLVAKTPGFAMVNLEVTFNGLINGSAHIQVFLNGNGSASGLQGIRISRGTTIVGSATGGLSPTSNSSVMWYFEIGDYVEAWANLQGAPTQVATVAVNTSQFSLTAIGKGGGGGGGGVNEVWVGTADPIAANPTIELWVDTDAYPSQLLLPQPTMRLQLTASQVVAAATTVCCVWTESANSDPQGIITLPTPTRIMVNKTGHYLLSYIHRWGAMIYPAMGSSEAKINAGDTVAGGTRLFIGQTIPGNDVVGARVGSTTKIIYLTAGDYINIFANHTEPTNSRSLDGSGGEQHTSAQLTALVGAKGDPGPQGPPGVAVTSYTHNQSTPSATWVVVHNLGFNPSTTAEDSAGNDIEGTIVFDSANQLTITFSAATAGKSYHS